MKVLVSYVHGGMLHEDFASSVLDFYRLDGAPDGRHIIGGRCNVRGLYVADSRNQVCKRFIEAQYPDGSYPEWLLFLDTDIVFKTQDVYTLLDHAEERKPCTIGGLYFGYLDGQPTPVWRKIHTELGGQWGTLGNVSIGTVEPVDAVGMGFTLIHRDVLLALAKRHRGDNWTFFAHDLYGIERLGEDLTFCYRAAQAGFKTWGDSTVIVGHIKPFTIGLGHFTKACEEAKRNAN